MPMPFAIVPEALPHRVYLKKDGQPVALGLFCEKPDGLRLLGPDGEDASARLGSTPRPKYLTLRLTDGATLTVPLGKQLDTLSFEHFDARQGTVEMFLRFLKTPAEFSQFWSMSVCHDAADFYNFGIQYGFPKRTFWIEFRGESGGRTRWHHSGLPPVFLMGGRWHHVALTWHNDGVHLQAELFVDGLRVTYEDRLPPLQPKPPARGLMFGGGQGNVEALCGEIDDVRISKTVRYRPPPGPRLHYQRPLTLQPCFTPPGDGELAVDEHTLALFRFDGTVEGVGVEGRRPIRAALSEVRKE